MNRLIGKCIAAAVLVVVGFGCAGRPAPPKLDRESIAQGGEAFAESRVDTLIDDRSRLLAIEYAITTVAAPRCGQLAWSHAGVLLASSDSFDDSVLRQDIEERFGRAARTVVAYVVPESGLDRAGIGRGDRLLRIDDVRLDEADDLTRHLIENRDRRRFDVRYQRGEEEIGAQVEFDGACPVVVSPDPSHLMLTFRNERLLVAVPFGLSAYVEDDDLLASVIAHEMAHALFDRDEESALDRERRADREGLLLAARAGFDVSNLPAYWRELALEYPWLIPAKQSLSVNEARAQGARGKPIDHQIGFEHYHIGARLPEIRAAVDRIVAQLKSSGEQAGNATEASP